MFNELDHHQLVALSTCFLPLDKSNEQVHLKNELAMPLRKLQETARKIAEVWCYLFVCASCNDFLVK